MNETYKKYLTYVKEYLTEHKGMESPNPLHPFRSRFQHSIRVLHWCERLVEGLDNVDTQALYTAAKQQQMEETFSRKVQRLIACHSDKDRMRDEDADLEMILLMEADLLDEEGAMGIVWDCMTMGNAHAKSYAKAYYHIMESSNKEEPNPMVTKRAIQFWEEKKGIAARFAKLLEDDLMIGSEYFDI